MRGILGRMNYGPYLTEEDQFVPIPPAQKDNLILPQATVEALEELGMIFRRAHERMVAKGYTIVDGKVVKQNAQPHNDDNRSNRKDTV